jgi:hypothetical protein
MTVHDHIHSLGSAPCPAHTHPHLSASAVFLQFYFLSYKLTDQNFGLISELIRRNLKVKRSRSLTNPSTNIIMRSMARTKPTIEISCTTNGHTTKMSTDSKHNQPLRLMNTLLICLLITKVCHRNSRLPLNLVRRTMTNEHGFSAPLDGNRRTLVNFPEVKFCRCECEYVSGGAHGGNEFDDEDAGSGGVGEADSGEHEVGECTTFGFSYFVDAVVCVCVVDGSEGVEGFVGGEPFVVVALEGIGDGCCVFVK